MKYRYQLILLGSIEDPIVEEIKSQIIEVEPRPTEPDKDKEVIVPEPVQQTTNEQKNTEKVDPTFSFEVTLMYPPCADMIWRLKYNPIPTPSIL